MNRFKKYLVVFCVALLMSGCGSAKEAEHITKVASLKGPTTIGLLYLMNSENADDYEFHMAAGADEILPMMVSGDADIALLPANVASVLYNKTNGAVEVLDINTLGVLYAVGTDENLQGISDLKNREVYITGKGTTPDYVFQYLLSQNNMADTVMLTYLSEPGEAVARLLEDPFSVAILPQPFVTSALKQNPALHIICDLSKEWSSCDAKGELVTGVTVCRKEFLEQYPKKVEAFINEHVKSTEAAVAESNRAQTAAYMVEAGILGKQEIAEAAIDCCNVTCITGDAMKDALQGYLSVLYEYDATSVGGKLPEEGFYYLN